MLSAQADSYLPVWVLNYLGAAKIHLQRTQFVLSIFNTISIALTVYYTSPIRRVSMPMAGRPFASVWGWLGFVATVAIVYLLLDRVLVYPAEISYNSHQASKRERNPGYDVTVDSNERIRRIEEQLADLERTQEDA